MSREIKKISNTYRYGQELYRHSLFSDANLVNYWRLEGNSNDSKASNNGTDTDITYGLTYGKFNQGGLFNGTSSYIGLTSCPITGNGNWSIGAWFKTTSTGSRKEIISFGHPSTTDQGVYLFINPSNILEVDLTNHDGPTGSQILTDGLWHFAVATHNSGTISSYIDGKFISSKAMSPNITSNKYVIGRAIYNDSHYFNGNLDDVFVFSRTLSAAEIWSLWGNGMKKIMGIDNTTDSFTKLLSHFDGPNSSSYVAETGQTISCVNQCGVLSNFTKFGAGALYFDGSSDYATVPTSTDWAYGTGAFTVEFWFRMKSLAATNCLYSHGGSNESAVTGGVVVVTTGGKIYYYCSGGRITGGTTLVKDTWYHFAMVGNGGADGSRTIKLFINGTQEGSTDTVNYNFAQKTLYFGANEDNVAECMYGWIDEIKISKGIALYNSNFTAPTLPFEISNIKKFMGVSNI